MSNEKILNENKEGVPNSENNEIVENTPWIDTIIIGIILGIVLGVGYSIHKFLGFLLLLILILPALSGMKPFSRKLVGFVVIILAMFMMELLIGFVFLII